MIISLIAAMAENRVIGSHNALPWDLPADRKRFKALTLGHPVIMGRKTYESIGRPLPGRKNIVVTGQRGYRAEGCLIAHSLAEAIDLAGDGDEAFICGGGDLYRQALPLADRIYLTVIHRDYEGDVFFPQIPEAFAKVESVTVDNVPSYTFLLLVR
ncbi:dihydrofolate reductase [Geotalea sp. SG265]|uniref:dihydrofolate reductase n=1 Tax=Geotalea sp. SG265 TaxID=2922867 RepID=UPI001FAFBB4A|nr:dihydrofolate reductase [Geotalea sp. SG265]